MCERLEQMSLSMCLFENRRINRENRKSNIVSSFCCPFLPWSHSGTSSCSWSDPHRLFLRIQSVDSSCLVWLLPFCHSFSQFPQSCRIESVCDSFAHNHTLAILGFSSTTDYFFLLKTGTRKNLTQTIQWLWIKDPHTQHALCYSWPDVSISFLFIRFPDFLFLILFSFRWFCQNLTDEEDDDVWMPVRANEKVMKRQQK